MIPAFDPVTGGLPPGDHRATLEEIGNRFGFTPRRRWLLKGLRAAVRAFWAAGIGDIFIDGSFCTEKPDPGDVDGYWVEPDNEVYGRVEPYWIDFEMVLVPQVGKWKWRMWADHGVEFFIHLDRKSPADAFTRIRGENVHFMRRRKAVHWGDFSIVQATVIGMRVDRIRHKEPIRLMCANDGR